MNNKNIVIKGARENNLKNVSLEIPKNKFIVFSGLSGSGKTTLAFDTIYSEGRRRYIESLSSYARQFLGNLEKPDVDGIEGLSPAISIDQKTTSHNPRSTVGTVTEIYDYLRLLFARIGVPYCPNHNTPIVSFSLSKMTDIALGYEEGTKLQILSPIIRAEKGTHKTTIEKLISAGFLRFRIDGEIYTSDNLPELDKNKRHNIDLVVDRVVIKDGIRTRVNDSISIASEQSNGYVIFLKGSEEVSLSTHHSCEICGFSVPKLEPRLFSFNAPLGYCPTCKGLGVNREVALHLLVPDPTLSIKQGAIRYYKNAKDSNIDYQQFKYLLSMYNIPIDVPFNTYTKKQLNIILNGSDKQFKYTLKSSSGNVMHRQGYIEGIKKHIERLYFETNSQMMRDYYEFFMQDTVCTVCGGARLNPQALSVKINGLNIYEVTLLSIEKLVKFIRDLEGILTENQKKIINLVAKEITNRGKFMIDVGLDYLTLSRMSMTLSGGEAQRIRLATQIGSRLSGVLYVLDEPSIGLHQKDNDKLIATLKDMRDLGNTLIVVEHDEDTLKAADHIVDIGPRAGVHGGEIVVNGSIEDCMNNERSITGMYLSGKLKIEVPTKRRKGNGKFISIKGASENNLKNINVDIPLGTFTCVSGVSGSGKSTLINETLHKAVKKILNKDLDIIPGKYKDIKGIKNIDKVVHITQEPIGRTPRSNPATYTKVFDDIRDLFAETSESKARGFTKGRFSFNVVGGRCEVCQGAGVSRISMNFLPDVYVKCDACNGKRYNEETLAVTYKGKNIFDVLEMTIDDACIFFENRVQIKRKLETLKDVGLGYIKLGQSATTISGGEAQRVKLAFELQKVATGNTLYILDEPTTGLHSYDIDKLITVLQRIVDHGNTCVVIEHNLEVLKVCDYIIDLGPDGGDKGGSLVCVGTPEEVAKVEESYTGQYLKKLLV